VPRKPEAGRPCPTAYSPFPRSIRIPAPPPFGSRHRAPDDAPGVALTARLLTDRPSSLYRDGGRSLRHAVHSTRLVLGASAPAEQVLPDAAGAPNGRAYTHSTLALESASYPYGPRGA
jgi:hypothetical protein